MTTALGPFHVIPSALVRDRPAVVVGRERRADPSAVLADHSDRQPAFGMVDVRDALVDRADRLGVAQDKIDLFVERPRPVQVAHPVELRCDPEAGEERDETSRVVIREVRPDGRIRARDHVERFSHVLGHPGPFLHRLRVHRVVVVDRVDESDVERVRLERAEERVTDDRSTKTGDRYGSRWSL